MTESTKAILVFGGGDLQLSLIEQCRALGLFAVVVDPFSNAPGGTMADAFEVVKGDDFEGTCAVVEKHRIEAIVTAATDKPLVMMAKIAKKYNFPFISYETALVSTDKWRMKEYFIANNIPCARGQLIDSPEIKLKYPLIIKPRDNSGSRGVSYCDSEQSLKLAFKEALGFSKMDDALVEEVIEGKEFSVESLHFRGETHIIQFTEKITSKLPYNVELGHIQPVRLENVIKNKISSLISTTALALGFTSCVAHTELKINERGIFILETSPRLGGDFITSRLVPLSTGINLERLLIQLALGESITIDKPENNASAIFYFNLPEGFIQEVGALEQLVNCPGVIEFKFYLQEGVRIPKITNSLDRYGYVIMKAYNRQALLKGYKEMSRIIEDQIKVI